MEKTKEKRKLTKVEKISKIVFLSIGVLLTVMGIIFTVIKVPIEGTIYKTNTTFEEREQAWNNEYRRLFDLYDATYSPEYFESEMELESGILGGLLYKTSTGGSILTIDIYNNATEKTIVYSIRLKNKVDESYQNITTEQIEIYSRETKSYTITVADGFDMDNYWIICSYRHKGHLWSGHSLTSYQRELERTKTFEIIDMIEDEIGKRPDKMKENSEDLSERPDYMDDILDARLNYIMCYMFAVLAFIPAIFIGVGGKRQTYALPSYSSEPMVEVIIKEVPVEVKHDEEDCKHHKIKKVVCLYCGARYKDSLDECPDCGSSRIKEEPQKEMEESDKKK